MANSPRPRLDAFKDSEARIRALTREVGTLREDLRREVKRRERAVAQSRQNDELQATSHTKVQELLFSNKRLQAELSSARETQQTGSERNRQALQALRGGLATVESAVAARAQQGTELLSTAYECMAQLKGLLLGGILEPGSSVSSAQPSGLEMQVTALLAEAVKTLGNLEGLLVGNLCQEPLSVSTGSRERREQPAQESSSSIQGREQLAQELCLRRDKVALEEEIRHLRSQLAAQKALSERAAATAATSSEMAGQRSDQSASRVGDLASEVTQLRSALDQARREKELLQAGIVEFEHRIQTQGNSASQLQEFVRDLQQMSLDSDQQAAGLREQLIRQQDANRHLEQQNLTFKEQLQEQQRVSEEYLRHMSSMQDAISAQQTDAMSALELVSASRRGTRHASEPSLAPATRSIIPAPAYGMQQQLPEIWVPSSIQGSGVGTGLYGTGLHGLGPKPYVQDLARSRQADSSFPASQASFSIPSRPMQYHQTSAIGQGTSVAAFQAAHVAAAAAAPTGMPAGLRGTSGRRDTSGSLPTAWADPRNGRRKTGQSGAGVDAFSGMHSSSNEQRGGAAPWSEGDGGARAGVTDAHRQSDQIREDMHDLDSEILHLETMLSRASKQFS